MITTFKGISFLLFASIISYPLIAQDFGGRAIGLSGASIAIVDSWSGWNNPGAIALLDKKSLSAGSQIPYGVPELGQVNASVIWDTRISKLGFNFSSSGFSSVRQDQFGVTMAFGKSNYSFGGALHVIQLGMSEYGTLIRPVLELGGALRILPKICFGLSFYNATFSSAGLESFNEWLPIRLRTGITVKPNEDLLFSIEFQKEIERALELKGGLEYHFNNHFGFVIGASSQPIGQSAGLILKSKRWEIIPSASHNSHLGISGGMSLSYFIHVPKN